MSVELADDESVSREQLRRIASDSLQKGRRFARRGAWGAFISFAVFSIFVTGMMAAFGGGMNDGSDLFWTGIVMAVGLGGALALSLRALFMRDVHQLEAIIEHGVPHRGAITSRTFVAESPLSGPSNMTVGWSENGREVSARMNDRSDVLKGPVVRDVVVLTRGRKRWVGVVVGDKLLLALRPPREYHIFGGNNA